MSLSVSALVWFCVVSLVMVELKANVLCGRPGHGWAKSQCFVWSAWSWLS